jgi:hypothetical protein
MLIVGGESVCREISDDKSEDEMESGAQWLDD